MKVKNHVELNSIINAGTMKGCGQCNAEFEDEDFAFALETGTCPYCHVVLDEVTEK